MMKRRSFLVGASALALGQLASGCNTQQASLKVRILKDSLPNQLRDEFQQVYKQVYKERATVKFDIEEQIKDIYTSLQIWKEQEGKQEKKPLWPFSFIGKKTPARADLVTLGDYWLEKAIQQKLIKPLDIEDLKGWQELPRPWQEIVKRPPEGQEGNSWQVWGAPYRWGTTVIAYRRDKFKDLGWKPMDWSDLWRPELRDRISLLDHPREVIGLTLKKLGSSYNTIDLSKVKNLEEELLALHQQVKFYSSDNYLQPLILGDTDVALGWSTDVLAAASTYRQIEAVVPLSGTALWADLWVQPASAVTDPLTKEWINFCWESKPAKEISLFTKAASPIIIKVQAEELPPDIKKNSLLLPDTSVIEESEFLKPLPKSAVEQYQALWQKIRSPKNSR